MNDPEKSVTPGTHDTGEGKHKVKTKHRKLTEE